MKVDIIISLTLEKARFVNWSREYGYFYISCEHRTKWADGKDPLPTISKNMLRHFKMKRLKNKVSVEQFEATRKKLSNIVRNFKKNSSFMSLRTDADFYALAFGVSTNDSVDALQVALGDGSYNLIDKNDFL